MRCPRCGEPLTKIDPALEKADDADADLAEPDDDDESEHWACHNDDCALCFPCFFNVHHPLRGPRSKPGDSWSISWIK